MGWPVELREGSAQELHDHEPDGTRRVVVNRVSSPAVVLGAHQDPAELPGALPGGIALAGRRTGGAAMWLAPGAQVWLDLEIPVDDPIHSDDVGEASLRVGRAWSRVIGAPARVWDGPMSDPAAQALACFAGVGRGEVVVGRRKLVGISQRRTARWSRVQCVLYLRWEPSVLLAALGPVPPGQEDPARRRAAAALVDGVAVLGDPVTGSRPGPVASASGDVDVRLAEALAGLLEQGDPLLS